MTTYKHIHKNSKVKLIECAHTWSLRLKIRQHRKGTGLKIRKKGDLLQQKLKTGSALRNYGPVQCRMTLQSSDNKSSP